MESIFQKIEFRNSLSIYVMQNLMMLIGIDANIVNRCMKMEKFYMERIVQYSNIIRLQKSIKGL